MTSITARNAKALADRNGTTVPQTKVSRGTTQTKVAKVQTPAPKPTPATAPTGVACGCGCQAIANPGRTYRPGHDARHASQVGQWLAANPKAPAEKVAEAYAALPTPALQAKARRFADNRAAEVTRKAAAARIRAAAKAALEAELSAL